MRPLLLPALRRIWRDRTTLQLGLGPAPSVLLCDLPLEADRLLDRLDGTADLDTVLAGAEEAGLDRTRAARLIGVLVRAGVVIDNSVATPLPLSLDVATRHRLAGDVASLSLLGSDAGGVLSARHRCMVGVYGSPRLAVPLAATLAAAGVGRIHVVGRGPVEPGHVAPGGFAAGDVGEPRPEAAAAALIRAAPQVDVRPLPPRRPADLVILAGAAAGDLDHAARLVAAGIAHLAISIRDTIGVVGPLVQPGRSSCLRCADLQRRERDPAWPVVAAHLATAHLPRTEAQDSALAGALAGLGALQALAQLDGQPAQTLNGTLEMALPDCLLRRRSWLPHPACGCRGRPSWREAG